MPPRIPLRALESTAIASQRGVFPAARNFTRAQSTNSAGPSSRPSGSKTKTNEPTLAESITGTAETGPHVVPPLARPLGSDVKPKAGPKTYVWTTDKFYDGDRQRAERKMLMEEASRGYFHDYNIAKREGGGKQWVAPKVLIREDKAKYFPNIAGDALSNGDRICTTDLLEGKVSLVTIISTRLSQEHAESFVQATLEDQRGNPNLNYVQINHQDNYLKGALISVFNSGLKRIVPRELWSKYIMCRGGWSELDVNQPMGLGNKIVGYVYLVDKNCKIRWAGTGLAFPEEVESLRTATEVLLRRSVQKAPDVAAGTSD